MNLGKTRLVQHLLLTCGFRRIHVQTTDVHADYGTDSAENEYNEAALKRHLDVDDCDAIILDDCLYDPEYVESDTFLRLMTQKRTAVFVTMLFAMTLTETIRRLFDYVFIFHERGVFALTKLFTLYCSPKVYPTCEALAAALRGVTEYPEDEKFRHIHDGACLVLTHTGTMWYRVSEQKCGNPNRNAVLCIQIKCDP